jgi:predicted DNA-binding transcriptional regulator AlpA
VHVPQEILDELADLVAAHVVDRLDADRARLEDGQVEAWHLVDVDEVGAMLGRSRRWVHGAVKDKALPYIRVDGGKLMFDAADVRAWCRSRGVPAETEPA